MKRKLTKKPVKKPKPVQKPKPKKQVKKKEEIGTCRTCKKLEVVCSGVAGGRVFPDSDKPNPCYAPGEK